MRSTLVMLLCACAVSTALIGCGRFAPGFIVTNDGQTIANTDENNRRLVLDSIRSQLDAQLGGHWRTVVTINELPVYNEGDDRGPNNSGWRWQHLTASVELIGDGTVPLPMSTESVRTVVSDYLSAKVDRPTKQLTLTVTSTSDTNRFTALAATAVATTAAPATSASSSTSITKPATTAAPSAQRYVVQSGDTWADLSNAFYNSPQHWKLIRDANPGITLAPGAEILIPVKQ